MKRNLRKHGSRPYGIAVVHGGPGALGEMAPVAKVLSSRWGVLEPLQKARSVEGQVAELKSALKKSGFPPMTLIGHSWGAWLIFILAARYPSLVRKIILVASGPFEARYQKNVTRTRLSRLNEKDREEAEALRKKLEGYPKASRRDLDRFINLMTKGDYYDPFRGTDITNYKYSLYQNLWPEVHKLRQSGALLEVGRKIRCPVIAIHGDYDPHPFDGVKKPLSRILKNFEFHLLEKCGHSPWNERNAKQEFYRILRHAISSS